MKEKVVIGYQLANEFNDRFKYGAHRMCAQWLEVSKSYFSKQLNGEGKLLTCFFFNMCQIMGKNPSDFLNNPKHVTNDMIEKVELKDFPERITNEDVGRTLVKQRREKHKSILQISNMLDRLGIENASMDFLNQRELGKTKIRVKETLALCDIYGISIDDLYVEALKINKSRVSHK